LNGSGLFLHKELAAIPTGHLTGEFSSSFPFFFKELEMVGFVRLDQI